MKLIVDADDFGLTLNVSKAILKGISEGIITDTNAIVNTLDFKSSAVMALDLGIHKMGIHLLLTVGKPVLPVDEVKSLVNEKGYFFSREEFKTKEIDINEVEKELEAQIQVFLETGLKLNHINTHHGFMNKSKEMTDLFIKLANKYHVPLRNEASRYGSEELVKYYENHGIVMTDYVYFNRQTPHHTVDAIKDYLNDACRQYKYLEIGCHPGYSDDYLRKISPLNDDREKELEVVMNENLKRFIDDKQITRISYSDFIKEKNYEKNSNEG